MWLKCVHIRKYLINLKHGKKFLAYTPPQNNILFDTSGVEF